jgi:hypothetical protein
LQFSYSYGKIIIVLKNIYNSCRMVLNMPYNWTLDKMVVNNNLKIFHFSKSYKNSRQNFTVRINWLCKQTCTRFLAHKINYFRLRYLDKNWQPDKEIDDANIWGTFQLYRFVSQVFLFFSRNIVKHPKNLGAHWRRLSE